MYCTGLWFPVALIKIEELRSKPWHAALFPILPAVPLSAHDYIELIMWIGSLPSSTIKSVSHNWGRSAPSTMEMMAFSAAAWMFHIRSRKLIMPHHVAFLLFFFCWFFCFVCFFIIIIFWLNSLGRQCVRKRPARAMFMDSYVEWLLRKKQC